MQHRPPQAAARRRDAEASSPAEAPAGRVSAGKASTGKEPLQVRIPVAVKRRFKSHAALRGLEPHALFVTIWEQYEASLAPEAGHGRTTGER